MSQNEVMNAEIQNQNLYQDYQGELINCNLCQKQNQIGINYDLCHHSICLNCIYKYFLSSGFKGLDIEGVIINCPKCKKGEKQHTLEDFAEYLKILVKSKNEIKIKSEENIKNAPEMNGSDFCSTHKTEKLSKYCKDCKFYYCNKCINELHQINCPNHELVNIEQGKDNIINNQNSKTINEKSNALNEIMNKNENLKQLMENQKIFVQKLESEKIKFNVEIEKIINDLTSLQENYAQKYFLFQSAMESIFDIINFSYLIYYTSSKEEQNQLAITKNLLDINYINKKLDFTEINNQVKKDLSEIASNTNFFSYELQWSSFEYKKSFELKSQDENAGEDCVTKIIELAELNQIVAGLIGGQIYIWNINDKSREKEIDAHKSAIWAMIKLSNNMIASGSSDKTIKIWNIDDFDKPIVLKGHNGTIFCLGELEKYKIISGSEDRTIKIWDILEKRSCIQTIRNDSKINCLYILPDPGFIVTGGDDNLIKIWNIYSSLVTDILQGHECTIWSITSLNSDSSIIASGSSDNSIIVWDLNNLKIILTLEGHDNTISCLRMMKNGLLLSSSWDTTIKIWNLKTRSCIASLQGHKNIVWDVIELQDGNIASCSSDNRIIVWEKKLN